MHKYAIVECVPNFSEGRDLTIIKSITDEIEGVDGVKLLDVDPGKATNRTVVTFIGHPDAVIEAAFRAIRKAAELIDMSKHKGEHPRMGATDVCPLIPISGISMEDTAAYSKKLGERVGRELEIPVYLYESAASTPERSNLATIRSGEYEGLQSKLAQPEWKPDFGQAKFNARSGATVIGARDFLVAYNVNLNTKSERKANSVAFDVRENGRVKTEKGKTVLDEEGNAVRVPGLLKFVKAIGWYINEYGIAQISMNLTNINETPLHVAFEECRKSADGRGLRVTGSELVGLVPKKVLTDAGKYFLEKQGRSVGVSEDELIFIAVRSLGLDELAPFDPKKKVLEYLLEDPSSTPLIYKSLIEFAEETASDSPAPGGGSISAYVGTLGVALGIMVANLSASKKGWEKNVSLFSTWAEQGQDIKRRLLYLVDADTAAFNAILTAIRMPKTSDDEIVSRNKAMNAATKGAIDIPLQVMKVAAESFDLLREMVIKGNPNSVSDAAVGALCVLTAIKGAHLNVRINCKGFDDTVFIEKAMHEAQVIMDDASQKTDAIMALVNATI